MSKRDKLLHPVTGSLAAVALLLLTAGLVGHAKRHHSGVPIQPKTHVAPESTKSNSENTYKSADLKAQESMATAAWVAVGISGLGLLGLFFTVRYALFAWRSSERSAIADEKALELTRKQLDEAREDAEIQLSKLERQVSAMQDTARASQRHAMITEDVAARQSRCYIEPIGGVFKKSQNPNSMLTDYSTVELECINHGASIGKDIYCLYEFEIIDLDKREGTLGWREFKAQYRSDHRNVAPSSEFLIKLDLDLARRVEEIPFDGKSLAVIRGAVHYSDVFDGQFRSGFVLLGFVPVKMVDLQEISFGMDQTSREFPTFEKLKKPTTDSH